MNYDVYILRKDEFEKFLDKLENESKARLARDIGLLKRQRKFQLRNCILQLED